MDWQDFINFRRMITPVIIKFLFWLGVATSVILGLFTFLGGLVFGLGDGGIFFLAIGCLIGPAIIVFGILSVRLITELLILAFQTHDTLVDIRSLLENQNKN